MRCLKSKVDTSNALEDNLTHLPWENGNFMLGCFIAGPLKVVLTGSRHFVVPNFQGVLFKFSFLHQQKGHYNWKVEERIPWKCILVYVNKTC